MSSSIARAAAGHDEVVEFGNHRGRDDQWFRDRLDGERDRLVSGLADVKVGQ